MQETTILIGSSDDLVVPVPPAAALGARGLLTAATVRIRTPSVAMPDAGEAAVVDPLSTTVGVIASAGDEEFTVASASDVRPGVALALFLGASTDRQLLVTPESVAGSVVKLGEPLPVPLAVNDLVRGWSVSASITEAHTETKGRGLAVVRATIGGVDYEFTHRFRIIPQAGVYTLTQEKLLKRYPNLRSLKMPHDASYEDAIQTAWDDILSIDLERRGLHPERIHAQDRLEVAHAAAVAVHMYRISPSAGADDVEEWGAYYRDRLDAVNEGKRWEYDAEGNLATPDDDVPDPTGSFVGFGR